MLSKSKKTLFQGTVEQNLISNQSDVQYKQQRVQEIRKQENQIAKQKVAQNNALQKKKQEEEEVQRKYNEYQEKLRLIEELNKAKEQSLIEIGKAQREAELFRQRQDEEMRQKQQFIEQFNKQAVKRFEEAQEWKKQQLRETEIGRQQQLAQLRKEASIIERQKEQESLQQYKENTKSYIEPQSQTESYDKFDKNASRRYLKPEDFAHTCFHNPTVTYHLEEEQENAIDKANMTLNEQQSQLIEKARQQREQERATRERAKKAFEKEQQKKLLEQLEEEQKFIRQQECLKNQQIRHNPRVSDSKFKQSTLNNAFSQICETDQKQATVKKHSLTPKNTRSLSKRNDEQKKRVKIFTKKPLDSNLYGEPWAQESQNDDYMQYPLQSPPEQGLQSQKKVHFSEIKVEDQSAEKQQLSSNKRNPSCRNQQYDEQEDNEFQNSGDLDHEQTSQVQEIDEVSFSQIPEPKPSQIQDIRSYIREQEAYLERLEQERMNTAMKMRQEELQLMNTFKVNHQRNTIPEESEEESSHQYDQSEEKQSSVYDQSQDLSQRQSSKYSLGQQSPSQYETIENYDSAAIMQQFLKPKKNTLETLQSPNSDLNYSLSEVKKDTLSNAHTLQKQNPQSPLYTENLQDSYPQSQSQEEEYSYRPSQQSPIQQEESLGDIFQKRKAELAKKLEQRQEQVKTLDKKGPTKEELIKIRKDMMKSKRQVSQDHSNAQQIVQEQVPQLSAEDERKAQLMKRLASGEKAKIEKKEMHALTNKNYEQLPEIRKQREVEERNESVKQRREKVKEMDQKLRESMKQRK